MLFKKAVKLAYHKEEYRKKLLPLLVRYAKKSGVPEWAEGEKFKNPESGNMVLFKSLPPKEQERLREQHKEKEKEGLLDKSKKKVKNTVKDQSAKLKEKGKGAKEYAVDFAKVGAAMVAVKAASKPLRYGLNKYVEKNKDEIPAMDVAKTAGKILGTVDWKKASAKEKTKFIGKASKQLAKSASISGAKLTSTVLYKGGLAGAAGSFMKKKTQNKINDAFEKASRTMYSGVDGFEVRAGKKGMKLASSAVGVALGAATAYVAYKGIEKTVQKVTGEDTIRSWVDKMLDRKIKEKLGVDTTKGPGKDKKIRLANQLEINEDLLVEIVMSGLTYMPKEKVNFILDISAKDGDLDQKEFQERISEKFMETLIEDE